MVSKKKSAKKKTTKTTNKKAAAAGKKKTRTTKKPAPKAATKSTAAEVPVETKAASPTIQGKAIAHLEDLERLFDDLVLRRLPRSFRREWPKWEGFPALFEERVPSIDVIDRQKEVVVRAEVPGIDAEDLDVSVSDRTLTIKGKTRKEEKEEREDFFRHEIRSGVFSRSVLLPCDINASKAKATFKDGVVELHLPKVKVSKRQTISLS